MGFTIRFTGFRKLIFPPTISGFKKWCIEVRKSRAFVKRYPLLSEESRERYSLEYVERKLMIKRLSGFVASLREQESFVLTSCLKGRPLDLRHQGMEGLFRLWQHQQRFLADNFIKTACEQNVGALLQKGRENAGMTKTETAKIMGVSMIAYSSYEEGKRAISFANFLSAMKLFGIKVIEI